MNAPIEQTLRPETLNEILLIDRINELHRIAYMGRGTSYGALAGDPNKGVMELPRMVPQLRLAAAFDANLEGPHGNLKLTARTHGPTKFGYGKYVTAELLQSLQPWDEARLFDEVWREGMHSLAKELRRIRENK